MRKNPQILYSVVVTAFGDNHKHYAADIFHPDGSQEYLHSDQLNELGREIWRSISGTENQNPIDPIDWDLL